MKKKKWNRVLAVLLMMVMSISLLSGCGGKSTEKEDAETITVYLWSTTCVVDVDITNQDGRNVCKATFTMFVTGQRSEERQVRI